MRRHLLTLRRPEALGSDPLWQALIRIALYVMVEGMAEFCRRHFVGSLDMGPGWTTAPLQAALAMFWAYVAHQRLAFRRSASVGKLAGAAVFVVVSLGCLDLELLIERLAPGLELGVWVLVSSAKFKLVRRFVWPVRPHSIEESA